MKVLKPGETNPDFNVGCGIWMAIFIGVPLLIALGNFIGCGGGLGSRWVPME